MRTWSRDKDDDEHGKNSVIYRRLAGGIFEAVFGRGREINMGAMYASECCLLRQMLSLLLLSLLVGVCSFPLITKASGLSSSKRRYCDNGYPFPPSEDQSFVEMLDYLLEEARSSLAGVEVSATDNFGRFEGTAGCLWHNCQIYDSECYPCDSTRDAEACIETVISEVKSSLLDSSSGYCVRTKEFATGERSVAPNDASTTFQVCGLQYKFLGSVLSLGRRSGY